MSVCLAEFGLIGRFGDVPKRSTSGGQQRRLVVDAYSGGCGRGAARTGARARAWVGARASSAPRRRAHAPAWRRLTVKASQAKNTWVLPLRVGFDKTHGDIDQVLVARGRTESGIDQFRVAFGRISGRIDRDWVRLEGEVRKTDAPRGKDRKEYR